MPETALEKLPSLIKRAEYASRFQHLLKDRADQFISSIIQVGQSMPQVEPRSIIAAGMMAASLDLPVNKNLGFAWIVPYKGVAQFQVGYKGYIQLGLRSGAYLRMNARPVNQEALLGFDEIGEPLVDWTKVDDSKPAVAYAFAFKLTNGFTKIAVWLGERVRRHAQRYSQSYRQGAAIWKENWDEMALKTVISNELRKWGILSIQMQRALFVDQAAARDVDASVEYPDNAGGEAAGLITGEGATDPGPTAAEQVAQGAPMRPEPAVKEQPQHNPQEHLANLVVSAGFNFDQFAALGRKKKWPVKWDDVQAFADVPADLCDTCIVGWKSVVLPGLQKLSS